MHDDLNRLNKNPSQKFYKHPKILKNLNVCQKSQKLGQKEWNAW